MGRYNLGFISDEDLYEAVKETGRHCRKPRNVFDSMLYLSLIDKLHPSVLKLAGNGWETPGDSGEGGFDMKNDGLHIYADIIDETKKEKPSMNFFRLKMQDKLLKDSQATCYIVKTYYKSSHDTPWVMTVKSSDRSIKLEHEHCREITMDKFYELVFADKDAFEKLSMALPTVIEDVMKDLEKAAK